MYKVIRYFTDLTDNSHAYNVGDSFPRRGVTVSDERIAELSSNKNKRGTPLIEEVADSFINEPTEQIETVGDDDPETFVKEEKPKKKGRKKNESIE